MPGKFFCFYRIYSIINASEDSDEKKSFQRKKIQKIPYFSLLVIPIYKFAIVLKKIFELIFWIDSLKFFPPQR